jgi:hypothetical protein
VHQSKPILCRSYPLAKLNKGNGEQGYYLNALPDCGVIGGSSVVRDWVGYTASAESIAASDAWTSALFRLIPILQKVSKEKSQDSYNNLFQSAFAFIYLMYDTSQNFAEQCDKNVDAFIEAANAAGI